MVVEAHKKHDMENIIEFSKICNIEYLIQIEAVKLWQDLILTNYKNTYHF